MKKIRQELIISLIKKEEIETQEILKERLEQAGFSVTQATVSRDISELGLVKSLSENGVNCYNLPERPLNTKFDAIFKQAVITLDMAGNIVAIKCHSGLANAACASIDDLDNEEVVGTIAGDDTIFVLCRNEKNAHQFIVKMKKHLL